MPGIEGCGYLLFYVYSYAFTLLFYMRLVRLHNFLFYFSFFNPHVFITRLRIQYRAGTRF